MPSFINTVEFFNIKMFLARISRECRMSDTMLFKHYVAEFWMFIYIVSSFNDFTVSVTCPTIRAIRVSKLFSVNPFVLSSFWNPNFFFCAMEGSAS